jgi:hypothetical protein
MSKATIQPLTDLERFELLQIMFPQELGEDADLGDEEDLLFDKFDLEPEQFDQLVGHLVMCAPVLISPLSGAAHHVLGETIIKDGQQHVMAAVKRDAVETTPAAEQRAEEECDHDWDDVGNGTMACTYPNCDATRPKRPEDDEEAR